jgi:DNA-directed RNA polymerase specialized sigma24 family protein
MAAVRGGRANREIAKHAQTCRVCSEILLVHAFLRRLKLREWQLLWQSYVKRSNHEKSARATGLQTERVRRQLSRARGELGKLIRAHLRPASHEVSK